MSLCKRNIMSDIADEWFFQDFIFQGFVFQAVSFQDFDTDPNMSILWNS